MNQTAFTSDDMPLNFINGKFSHSISKTFNVFSPLDGSLLCSAPESDSSEVEDACVAANRALPSWRRLPAPARGEFLFKLAEFIERSREDLVGLLVTETGKTVRDANGEVDAAIAVCRFFAGEGRRLYSNVLQSANAAKTVFSVREPVGVWALIVPSNTALANIAWKVCPALVSGNTVILKSSEYAPSVATLFFKLVEQTEFPAGVANLLHGGGGTVGKSLTENLLVNGVSFTGSTRAGIDIGGSAAKRLCRTSLELGGKNPFIVCNDADVSAAVHWATLSAFSNAGQRCAAGSRLIVQNGIYDEFMGRMVAKAKSLQLGVCEASDLGPVMSRQQKAGIIETIKRAIEQPGTRLLCGEENLVDSSDKGCYVHPTLIEVSDDRCEIAQKELFGPVASVHRFDEIEEALFLANNTEYGLTAAVHTKSMDDALIFLRGIRAGVVNVNSGTFGSEPHFPFGGFGSSGNGTREPGTQALDVYTELKTISMTSQ